MVSRKIGQDNPFIDALINAERFERVTEFLAQVTGETDLHIKERSSAIIRKIMKKPEFARDKLLAKYARELSEKLDRSRSQEARHGLLAKERGFYSEALHNATNRAGRVVGVSSSNREAMQSWRRETVKELKLHWTRTMRKLFETVKGQQGFLEKTRAGAKAKKPKLPMRRGK